MRDLTASSDIEAALIPIQAALQPGSQPAAGAPAGAVANLGITVSNPPTQAEVQSIANKVDALLNALRSGGGLAQ